MGRCRKEGCEKKAIARDMCSKHYYRWYRNSKHRRRRRRRDRAKIVDTYIDEVIWGEHGEREETNT